MGENETITTEEISFEGWDDPTPEEEFDDTAEDTADDGGAHADEAPDVGGDADQQTAEVEEETGESADGNETPDADAGGANQTFELKHLDEVKTVGRDEVISLAQKGMDYDRIKDKYSELKAERDKFTGFEEQSEFIRELAENAGMSVEELIDSTRARLYKNAEAGKGNDVDDMTALMRVQNAKAERARARDAARAEAKTKADAERAEEEKSARQKIFLRFAAEHKNVKAEAIPKEVWADFNSGKMGDLSDCYTRYENGALKKENCELKVEIARLKLNEKNKDRSTGSRKGSGGKPVSDPIFAGWDD